MALGPFVTYVPPGVYTQTLTNANVSNVVAGLRIPVIVGTGMQNLEQSNIEIVRGSSSSSDQQILAEDVSLQWVVSSVNPQNLVLGAQTGALTMFETRNYPITDGSGTGRVTTNPNNVTVTVNGVPVAIAAVNGTAGVITLQVPTQPKDLVLVSYYFHRGDTSFTDNVSAQVTPTLAILQSPGFEPFAITTGTNDALVLTVNGSTYTVTLPQGALTAAGVASAVASAQIPNLGASVFTDNDGLNHLQLSAPVSIVIGSGNANGPLGWTPNTATNRNAVFRVFNVPVVDGSGGGVTTTTTSKVVVLVNNVQVIPKALDGANGLVTLPSAPPPGATVTVQYWANTWQNTFDYLPNSLVNTVISCGIAPNRADYIQGADFSVSNPTADSSIVNWGVSFVITAASTSVGGTPFNNNQITGLLVDNKMWLAACKPVTDTSVIPAHVSTTVFTLPEIPTTGNGRNTTLGLSLYNSVTNGRQDLITNRPDLVQVYAGRTLRDALGRPQPTVLSVNGALSQVTLANPLPPDYLVFATFYYNTIADDTYIFTNTVPGAVGQGQYTVHDSLNNTNLYQVRFGSTSGLGQQVQWPRGVETIPDAFYTGVGSPVSETITVTFGSLPAANAGFTNLGASPYSIYVPSATWVQGFNGSTASVNLNTAAPALIASGHVSPIQTGLDTGKILFPSSDTAFNVTINGTLVTIQGPLTGTFDVTDTSPTLTASVSQTGLILPGQSISFSSQPTILYTVLSVAGTTITLTAPYTGTTTVAATASLGWSGGYNYTPTQIVSAMNGAIDAVFTATAPNTAATFYQIGPSTGDVIFTIKSVTTPGALPGGFDANSKVQVNQGTTNATLGFAAFQNAVGTPGAINKPATLLGSLTGPFNITTGLNDNFKFTLNGIAFSVTLPGGSAVAASAVVTAINTVPGLSGVASVGTLANVNLIRLTSQVNDTSSSLVIGGGTANAVLGFTQNQTASQTLVAAGEIVDVLMASSAFTTAGGVCYSDTINGQLFITFESLTVGAATSSVYFVNSANSAFNPTTGLGIVPGTSGDDGEDAQQNFVVTSSNPAGSAGTGIPGQTYTDAQTGLRFTVLPAQTAGGYTNAGSFTMTSSQSFLVDPSRPFYSIPGLETTVSNTVGVVVGDSGSIQTFNPSGVSPSIGDFYYISYQYQKQDFSVQLYQQLSVIEANFGAVATTNPVSLAAYLAILNGALIIGISQVLAVPNTAQASDASYISAIQALATPLPGSIKPNIIVPLATSTAVYSYLTQHVETMSLIQNQSERMGFIGFASGTVPSAAQTVAQSLVSNRMVAFYPDSVIVTLTDELGNAYQAVVDGTMFAVGAAGAVVSPSVDVATPYTRRTLQGYTSIPRVLDPIDANQTAVSGVTILEDLNQLIRIRQGLTTNMTSILTRLPTVTQISDYVQQQSRSALDSFVGTKFLSTRTNEVVVTMTGLFKSLVQAEIVGAFTGLAATVDPNDPTTLDFTAYYQPIFPLLYIVLTFNLRANI